MKKAVKVLSGILMIALLAQIAAPAVFGIGGSDGDITAPILDDGNRIVYDKFDSSEPPEYDAEETGLSPIIGEDSRPRHGRSRTMI